MSKSVESSDPENTFGEVETLLEHLSREEEQLIARLKQIRLELGHLDKTTQPEWMSELPAAAWYPGYLVGRGMANLSPYKRTKKSSYPTISDWKYYGNIDAFVANCIIAALAVGLLVVLL